MSYLLGRLIGKYWPGTAWVKLSPQEARAELASVLGGLSAQLRPGEKELLVIDALDEATTASDGFTAAQMIPAAIPEGVFFIVSARRNLPGIEHWSWRGDFEQIELRADLAENRADAYQFVRWKLGERVTEQWVRRLADLVRWILGADFGVYGDHAGRPRPANSRAVPGCRPGLDDWYAGFWERLRQRFEESPADLELIESVMGAIAVAGGPVTRNEICELMGGNSHSRFEWSMRFVAQYLDIAPGATSDGTAAVDGPELFAVFHESFRTFLVQARAVSTGSTGAGRTFSPAARQAGRRADICRSALLQPPRRLAAVGRAADHAHRPRVH